ncbi:hypothetical protein STEG23_029061 [Scotinomys teguina]
MPRSKISTDWGPMKAPIRKVGYVKSMVHFTELFAALHRGYHGTLCSHSPAAHSALGLFCHISLPGDCGSRKQACSGSWGLKFLLQSKPLPAGLSRKHAEPHLHCLLGICHLRWADVLQVSAAAYTGSGVCRWWLLELLKPLNTAKFTVH